MSRFTVLALACLGGCSLLGVKGPPPADARHGPLECTDERSLPILDTVFGLAEIGLGTGLTVSLAQDSHESPGKGAVLLFIGVPAILVGVVTVASAGYGYSSVSRCELAKRSERESQERGQARERAWILTKTAATAARNADCASVIKIDAEVHTLDADFHDTIFARDAAIARCMASTRNPSQ